MPFLRFSRDRRGYENTYLLHATRRRSDKDRPSLLYWFRTPAHVKVGRAAFDETAIRLLEDQHPGVEFDWPKILAAKPPLVDTPEPERPPRRTATRRAADPAPASRPPIQPAGQVVPASPAPSPPSVSPTPVVEPASLPPLQPPALLLEPERGPARRFVRVFDRTAEPESDAGRSTELQSAADTESEGGGVAPEDTLVADTEETPHHLSDPSAVERLLGSEQLSRLRGQYAAVLARIGRRVPDATQAESLRTLAERINPDTWVTEEDVRQGLAGSTAVQDELARHIGRRRRRRRRGRGGEPTGAQSSASTAEELTDPLLGADAGVDSDAAAASGREDETEEDETP